MRAPESARTLEVKWERVSRIAPERPVITGAEVEDGAIETPTFDKPVLVLVCDELAECPILDELESDVFADDKVALGMKAFRAVRMTPEDAETDPLLEDTGERFPRIILLDPLRSKNVVIDRPKRLAAKPLYSAMKKLADGFYEERLDSIVRKNLKLLAKLDKLAPEEFKLKNKLEDLDDGASGKAKRIDAELDKLREEMQAITDEQDALWSLTRREVA